MHPPERGSLRMEKGCGKEQLAQETEADEASTLIKSITQGGAQARSRGPEGPRKLCY